MTTAMSPFETVSDIILGRATPSAVAVAAAIAFAVHEGVTVADFASLAPDIDMEEFGVDLVARRLPAETFKLGSAVVADLFLDVMLEIERPVGAIVAGWFAARMLAGGTEQIYEICEVAMDRSGIRDAAS